MGEHFWGVTQMCGNTLPLMIIFHTDDDNNHDR